MRVSSLILLQLSTAMACDPIDEQHPLRFGRFFKLLGYLSRQGKPQTPFRRRFLVPEIACMARSRATSRLLLI